MATAIVNTKCCGVGEMTALSHTLNIAEMLQALQGRLRMGYDHFGRFKPYGAIVFTGVSDRVVGDHASVRMDDYAQTFADYISAHKLGVVTLTAEFINWTGNRLKMFVWSPDYEALHAHIDAMRPVPADIEAL